jgi:hypothetical protein
LSNVSSAASTSYGEDRAQIEDLQARTSSRWTSMTRRLYASTFTPDGILDYGEGDVKGREAIIKVIGGMPNNRVKKGPNGEDLRPSAGRHQITNIVIKVTATRPVGRSSWFHVGNDNATRANTIGGFGHYEDEMVKVNGSGSSPSGRSQRGQRSLAVQRRLGNPAW